jgi:hypothetical protein
METEGLRRMNYFGRLKGTCLIYLIQVYQTGHMTGSDMPFVSAHSKTKGTPGKLPGI